jgi:hypothetical protein
VLLGRGVEFWISAAAAATFYYEAHRLDPGLAEAHLRLGEVLARCGRWTEASRAFAAAARLRPHCVETYGNLVLALARAREPDAAIDALRRLIDIRPGRAELYVLLGALLRRRRRQTEAVRAFRRAVQLEAPPAWQRFFLGEALLGSDAWRAVVGSFGAAVHGGNAAAGPADGASAARSVLNTRPERARPDPVPRPRPSGRDSRWALGRRRALATGWRRGVDALRRGGRVAMSHVLVAAGWGMARGRAPHFAIRLFRGGASLRGTPRVSLRRPGYPAWGGAPNDR